MKKLTVAIVAIFAVALLFSCKSHHRCAAYSKADVKTVQKPS